MSHYTGRDVSDAANDSGQVDMCTLSCPNKFIWALILECHFCWCDAQPVKLILSDGSNNFVILSFPIHYTLFYYVLVSPLWTNSKKHILAYSCDPHSRITIQTNLCYLPISLFTTQYVRTVCAIKHFSTHPLIILRCHRSTNFAAPAPT